MDKNYVEKNTGLIIYGNPNNPDYKAINQIYKVRDRKLFGNNLIAIMPDYHPGSGCTIGFTSKLSDLICPNIVGVDLGCGISSVKLNISSDMDLEYLHEKILECVDVGNKNHSDNKRRDNSTNFIIDNIHKNFKDDFYLEIHDLNDSVKYKRQLGSLGGGNHFIELGVSEKSNMVYLTVHTGSRRFGFDSAKYFQREAECLCSSMKIGIERELSYFPTESKLGFDYLNRLYLAQQYAQVNRQSLIHQILKILNDLKLINDIDIHNSSEYKSYIENNMIESVHNYIEFNDKYGKIVRKGAISAYENEKVVIPLSMGHGVLLGTGKGNKNWNYSAPHGAGRVSSRMEVKRKVNSGEISNDEILSSLNGVVTNDIETIKDEIPQAYKDPNDIIPYIDETVEIDELIKPILNIKGA